MISRPHRTPALVRTAGLLGLLLALGPDRGAAQSVPMSSPLRPGDVVRLSVSRDTTMNGDYPVDEAGQVALPLVGMVETSGVPAEELKRRIIAAFEEQLRNQAIQVIVLRRVRVLGEVRTPGLYHVDPTMTLGDALALAGGRTPNGERDEIEIRRDGRKIEASLDEMAFEQLYSGDQIYVPERSWLARNATWVLGTAISTSVFIIVRTLDNN